MLGGVQGGPGVPPAPCPARSVPRGSAMLQDSIPLAWKLLLSCTLPSLSTTAVTSSSAVTSAGEKPMTRMASWGRTQAAGGTGTTPGCCGVCVRGSHSPPVPPAWRGSWRRRPHRTGQSSRGSGSRSAGSPGAASAALGGDRRRLSHCPPVPPTSRAGSCTYGAAAPKPRPGAGRRCGSSSRPSRAGRCGISPAGLRAGLSGTVTCRGHPPATPPRGVIRTHSC